MNVIDGSVNARNQEIKITDLEDSEHFPTVDSTFATGLIRAIPKGHEVEVELNYLEEEYDKQDTPAMVKGRQIWFLIIKHYHTHARMHQLRRGILEA